MAEAATETKPKRWYIVHAYSNFENKVADSIREQAKQRGLSHLFDEIMVPKEKVVEVRRGRKVDAERKFFPGYVLVKMNLTDEAYHLIKNTPKVTGFLGADKKPMPISEAEAQRILNQVQEGIERPKPSISFEVGEQEEDRRERREDEHHRGGDAGFLARGPGDLVGLLTHFLQELERVQLRHGPTTVLNRPHIGTRRPKLQGRD